MYVTRICWLRGGSAGIRKLYSYVASSGDICYDYRSFAVVTTKEPCQRADFSAPSVPSCICASNLSFKICVFQVVKGSHSRWDCCYCIIVIWELCKSRVQLEAFEIGEIQVPVVHERKVLSRLDLHQIEDLFLYFLKILTWSASNLEL